MGSFNNTTSQRFVLAPLLVHLFLNRLKKCSDKNWRWWKGNIQLESDLMLTLKSCRRNSQQGLWWSRSHGFHRGQVSLTLLLSHICQWSSGCWIAAAITLWAQQAMTSPAAQEGIDLLAVPSNHSRDCKLKRRLLPSLFLRDSQA